MREADLRWDIIELLFFAYRDFVGDADHELEAFGFGRAHHLHSDRLLTLSESLPAVSVAVDRRERIEQALPEVLELGGQGLVTLERARLYAPEEAGDVRRLTPGLAAQAGSRRG